MRKMMTKEVTKTTVKVTKIEMKEGKPEAIQLPDEVILGNVSFDKAQKLMNKKYEEPVTVYEVHSDTKVYEMEVDEFIKLAKVKTDEQDEADKAKDVTVNGKAQKGA